MVNNTAHQKMLNSPVRRLGMKVSLYNGDTLIQSFTQNDALKSVKIERLGESKFFGFGVCHKANVKLIDTKRLLDISTVNSFTIEHGVGNDYFSIYPTFYISEVRRDENTNELSITAYDALYNASGKTVNELDVFGSGYTLQQFGESCARLLGLVFTLDGQAKTVEAPALYWDDDSSAVYWDEPTEISWNEATVSNIDYSAFDLNYPTGANFEGTETVRDALDDLAEATQTFYFISGNNLIFKRLVSNPVITVTKEDYFTLSNKDNRRLATIANVTELGDNTEATTGLSGTTQYVRDNAFWSLRDDINTLLDNAIKAVGNLSINQFDCTWRGNYLLELGDCIGISTKDNKTVTTFLINDTVEYNGGLTEKTSWKYENAEETESNPSNLGDALKQTFARVDKANKQIDLVVKDVQKNSESISQLQVSSGNISASVSSLEKNLNDSMDNMNSNITELSSRVDATMTSEQVKLEISKEMANGVDKVKTSTGFTFDENGMNVSKSDSEMDTTINEDGMRINRSGQEVLKANNQGVDAKNLHATTYLIVGKNSRFEDYGQDETGCFWIG